AIVSESAGASYFRVPLLVIKLLFAIAKLGARPAPLRMTVPPLIPMGPRAETKTPPLLQVIVPGPSQTTVYGPGVLLALRLWLTILSPVPPKSSTQAEPAPNTA